MKSGKVSDTVLNRSILKEVQAVNQAVPCPRVGGGAILLPENDMACAMQTVIGEGINTAYLAAVRAVNSLAAKAAVPRYVSVAVTVPEEMDERDLRRMQERLGAYLKEKGAEFAGGHTAVSRAAAEPVVSVCAHGIMSAGHDTAPIRIRPQGRINSDANRVHPPEGAMCSAHGIISAGHDTAPIRIRPQGRINSNANRVHPPEGVMCSEHGNRLTEEAGKECRAGGFPDSFLGLDVVMTKHCGLSGTALLAGHYKEKLTERYPRRFIERAEQFLDEIQKNEECFVALQNGAVYAHAAAEGGIFGALWEMAEYAQCGLEIALRQIPILQETVEICEFFDINPYQLRTEGVFLFLAAHGERLCEKLTEAGIPAVVIGKTVAGLDRAVRNEEEVRYLEPNRVEAYECIRAKGGFVVPAYKKKQ